MSRREERSPPKEADVELSLEEELLEVSEVIYLIIKKEEAFRNATGQYDYCTCALYSILTF